MKPKISSAEWEVMNVMWSRSEATAAEVFAALPNGKEWKQKTVNTFLTRLVAKGVLKVSKDNHVNVYAPALRRQDCVREASRHFLQRVFQGATGPLLVHFCGEANLTPDEITELENMLRRMKGRK
jgi:BlaI family penicillinase repressor